MLALTLALMLGRNTLICSIQGPFTLDDDDKLELTMSLNK